MSLMGDGEIMADSACTPDGGKEQHMAIPPKIIIPRRQTPLVEVQVKWNYLAVLNSMSDNCICVDDVHNRGTNIDHHR